MPLYRDDCASAKMRSSGSTCICARITSIQPTIVIEDKSGSCVLDTFPSDSIAEVGDLCYCFVRCGAEPLRCRRLTVIPPEMFPVALYQLELFRRNQNAMKP
ncbi:hypothetical protein QR680_019178 [Steinernema hermaphroditum]|uniref:Uncharacterized protein n=1 Tax=Steinernema hermaphroditum TaxID=289476 RepID=A0AA39LRV5_9BILA|nr:hypothetical protein QR680_019178 [Steinernema hermaphroditum]